MTPIVLLIVFSFPAISPENSSSRAHDYLALKYISSTKDFEDWKTLRKQYSKFTDGYSYGWPDFSCHAPTDFQPASDVHHLAPWHISVIGALGDSLTAGRSADANTIATIFADYRGLSFATGGDFNLSNRATLYNIFSQFSPHLIGGSHNISSAENINLSQFNLAHSGAFASDVLRQAKELVNRIKSNRRVIFETDWKFINIFIGSNDLCKICLNETEYGADHFITSISAAIEFLRDSLPRTFVNLMPAAHVEAIADTQNYKFCEDYHRIVCPCLFNMSREQYSNVKSKFDGLLDKFNSEKYQTDDFAVAISPGINISHLPLLGNNPNIAFLALDCFHFSTVAHDAVAKILWRNLFEPFDNKFIGTSSDIQSQSWKCPPVTCPFLRTVRNSYSCLQNTKMILELKKPTGIEIDTKVFLPSMNDLERRANLEEHGPTIIVLFFGAVFVILALAFIIVIIKQKRNTRKQATTERTPLLLTANLYDQEVF